MGNKRLWHKILGYSIGQEVRLKKTYHSVPVITPLKVGTIIDMHWDTCHVHFLYYVKFGPHVLQLIKGEFE
jgi:hypothetical protein